MIRSTFIFFSLFWCFTAMSQQIRFAAPTAIGNAKGLSQNNAADFLDKAFWADIKKQLVNEDVIVNLVGGDYSRAYTNGGLIITNMGNGKNRLTLIGDTSKTIFRAPSGLGRKKSQLIKIENASNVAIRNIKFTGDGELNYVLAITSFKGSQTKNILIDGCVWEDMKGVVYGATGATNEGTENVTFKNCIFKRIGMNAGSHMIYNAYSSRYISVINCYFENCTGDYVRFRDKCDYGVVKGCTFIHNNKIPAVKFIAMPLYNDGIPFEGNESFATNYAFTHNTFSSTIPDLFSIQLSNRGFTAPGFNFILTPQEGNILLEGTDTEKKKLMEDNFGILTDKIRVYGNKYENVNPDIYIISNVGFGAISKGWQGRGEITNIINKNPKLFKWEKDLDN